MHSFAIPLVGNKYIEQQYQSVTGTANRGNFPSTNFTECHVGVQFFADYDVYMHVAQVVTLCGCP